jgi:hypothetical protein
LAERPEQLDEQFVDDFLDRFAEARRSRDADKLVSFCTEDVVFDDAGEGKTIVGRAALREFFAGIYGVVSDFELELSPERYLSLDRTKAAVQCRAAGTLRHPSEERIDIEVAEFYEFRDGLVSRWTFFARDRSWLGRQWGS